MRRRHRFPPPEILSKCSRMTCLNRKFGYVEFASEEDRTKALELNGKKVMGQEMKLDMPRSKESNQEGKKGTITLPQGTPTFNIELL